MKNSIKLGLLLSVVLGAANVTLVKASAASRMRTSPTSLNNTLSEAVTGYQMLVSILGQVKNSYTKSKNKAEKMYFYNLYNNIHGALNSIEMGVRQTYMNAKQPVPTGLIIAPTLPYPSSSSSSTQGAMK